MLKSVFEHRINFSNQLKRRDAKTRDFGKYIFQWRENAWFDYKNDNAV